MGSSLQQLLGCNVLFQVTDGEYTVVLPETDRYLDFLQQLSDMGAAMRRIITKTVCDPQLYSTFSAGNNCDLLAFTILYTLDVLKAKFAYALSVSPSSY